MEFNRHQFFFIGVLLLLVGFQLRLVESYLLTPEATRLLVERGGTTNMASTGPSPMADFAVQNNLVPAAKRQVIPPEWAGWCLVSIGAVLVLHSLAMPKPS
jgi:hypothetical protein